MAFRADHFPFLSLGSFHRQSVESGTVINMVSVSSMQLKALTSFKPVFRYATLVALVSPLTCSRVFFISANLLKRSANNVRWQKRKVILSERSVVYSKTDASTPSGVIPIDWYGLTLFGGKFRLSNPNTDLGLTLKETYDFDGDTNNEFGHEVLKMKNLPIMFGVPWHWAPKAVLDNLTMLVNFLEEHAAWETPNAFQGNSGSVADVSWMVELMDTGSEARVDVLNGCDVRSVLTLFKRWIFLLPSPFLPHEACLLIQQSVEQSDDQFNLAEKIGTALRNVAMQERAEVVQSFHAIFKVSLQHNPVIFVLAFSSLSQIPAGSSIFESNVGKFCNQRLHLDNAGASLWPAFVLAGQLEPVL